eukprot:scaffold602141_cov299-Attheya_sp.AAC.1
MAHQQAPGGGVAPMPGPVAGGAPPAGPQGGGPVPVAPQLPYAADPGTITGWLASESVESTPDTISDEIEAVTQRYAGLPAVGHQDYEKKLRE